MLSPFKIRWAIPTLSIHHMLLLGVSKKPYWCLGYNATVLDLDVYDAWEDPENYVLGGGGCPENFILVFSQRAVRTWPPFRSNWTQGVLLLLEVVNNSISKETYNNLWSTRWDANPLSPNPRDTHMRCLANNLNSVARSVAYLLNIQADRRSHPAYFSWRIISSSGDSRRPSCQLLV